MILNLKKYKSKEVFWGILLFLLSEPYFVWGNMIIQITCLLLVYGYILINSELKKGVELPFALFTLFYMIVALRLGALFGAVYTLIIPLLLLAPINTLQRGFSFFTYIYSIIIGISILVFIAVVFFGIPISHTQIPPLNELRAADGFMYDKYPFLVSMSGESLIQFQRFHGVYDEPGVVGTIDTLILYANKGSFKKWYLIPVFVSGVLSFSLFFYISLFLLLIIRFKIGLNGLIMIVVVIGGGLFLLSQIEGIDILLFNRFKIEDGDWIGNSRYDYDFKTWYDKFSSTADYYIGLGAGSSAIYNKAGASYKDIIVDYGVITFIIYISSFIIWVLKVQRNVKDRILTLFFIMGLIYTRPFYQSIFFVLSYIYIIYRPKSKEIIDESKYYIKKTI